MVVHHELLVLLLQACKFHLYIGHIFFDFKMSWRQFEGTSSICILALDRRNFALRTWKSLAQ